MPPLERSLGQFTSAFWSSIHQKGKGPALAVVLLIGAGVAHAQTPLTVSLQPSNYQGYQISCFGKQNGSINATISGGTAPYQKSWSNGATTEDLSGLLAGYYKLTVTDADSTVVVTDIWEIRGSCS